MKGSCLCGVVQYEVDPPALVFQNCHCSRCRKLTGTAFSANMIVKPEQFRWLSGEEQLGRFELEDAKYFATCFCKRCGSTLPWLVQGGRSVVVPVGTMDDPLQEQPTQNIHWASRADWFNEDMGLTCIDTMPGR